VKINKMLKISTWVSLCEVSMMIVFAWLFLEAYWSGQKMFLADEMKKTVFERVFLRDDHLINPSERVRTRWYAKSETLRVLLESFSERFTDTEDVIEGYNRPSLNVEERGS